MRAFLFIIFSLCLTKISICQNREINWDTLSHKPNRVLLDRSFFIEKNIVSATGKENLSKLIRFLSLYPNGIIEISNPYFSKKYESRKEKEILLLMKELNKMDSKIKERIIVEPNKSIKYFTKYYEGKKLIYFQNKILVKVVTFGE